MRFSSLTFFPVWIQSRISCASAVDYEVLEEFHEGIIALSACLAGAIPSFLRRGLYEEAKEEAEKLRGIFGKDNPPPAEKPRPWRHINLTTNDRINASLFRRAVKVNYPVHHAMVGYCQTIHAQQD